MNKNCDCIDFDELDSQSERQLKIVNATQGYYPVPPTEADIDLLEELIFKSIDEE